MFKYLNELERKKRNAQVPEAKQLEASVCELIRASRGMWKHR